MLLRNTLVFLAIFACIWCVLVPTDEVPVEETTGIGYKLSLTEDAIHDWAGQLLPDVQNGLQNLKLNDIHSSVNIEIGNVTVRLPSFWASPR